MAENGLSRRRSPAGRIIVKKFCGNEAADKIFFKVLKIIRENRADKKQ